MSLVERAALIALLRQEGEKKISWHKVAQDVRKAGSALLVAENNGFTAPTLWDDSWAQSLEQAEAQLISWDEAGLNLVTVLDDEYPSRLADVKQLPPFFFYSGSFSDADAEGLAVIGSRRASDDSLRAAGRFALELSDAGVSVVSGLAAGIDTAAHSACLGAKGRAVAVIGTGITRCFPTENKELQEKVANRGLLISQFWPEASPTKMSFPLRNELMAGWCWGNLVVQADERSGARIQARVAVAQGRRLFFYRTMEHERWARELVNLGSAQFVDSVADILGERDGGTIT
jgi:DNA processing protein